MTISRVTYPDQESYTGSVEEFNGLAPADKHLFTHAEANELKDVANNHADRLELYGTPKSEDIGNGVDVYFIILHDYPDNSCTVEVRSNVAPRNAVGVVIDHSVQGQVTIGPFATPPMAMQYKVSIK